MDLDDILVILLAGGAGERLYPADQRTGETGRLLRRAVPDHRLHAQQLHQLGAAAHLHRHAVQVALAQPPHPDGLERRVGGAGRVHRDPAAAEAGRRALVSRHRRRGVSRTSTRSRARAPSHVIVLSGDHVYKMDYAKMLRFHLEQERRRDAGHASRCRSPTAAASASSASTTTTASSSSRRSRRSPPPVPGVARRRAGVDGHLHLQGRRAGAGARGRRGARRQPARLRQEHHPVAHSAPRRSTRTASTTRTRRPRSTGATSARSTPTSKPAWTCARSTPSSTSTIRSGRCAPISRRRRRPSSCSPKKGAAAARRSTRSSRTAASSRAAGSAAASSARTSASTASATSSRRS